MRIATALLCFVWSLSTFAVLVADDKSRCDAGDISVCERLLKKELGESATRKIAEALCTRHRYCDSLSKLNKNEPNAIHCSVPRTQYGPDGKQVSSGYGKSFYALTEPECKAHCDRQWAEDTKELPRGNTLKARCRVGKEPSTRDIASYP